jgi:hypothetical protein
MLSRRSTRRRADLRATTGVRTGCLSLLRSMRRELICSPYRRCHYSRPLVPCRRLFGDIGHKSRSRHGSASSRGLSVRWTPCHSRANYPASTGTYFPLILVGESNLEYWRKQAGMEFPSSCLERVATRAMIPDILREGGWRQARPSPTGSGPEGSSPNERFAGCSSSLPPRLKAL